MFAQLSGCLRKYEVVLRKTRGELSSNGVSRSETKSGAISHKYAIPITEAILAGSKKSNIENFSTPMSAATETTKRFVEVPIVVHIPPTSVANPIGINTPEGERLVRKETLIKIGSNSTTTGVLFTKALNTAPISKVRSKEIFGLSCQSLASDLPIGSSAPVRTRA